MARYIDRDTAIKTVIEMCVKVVGHGITQIDAVDIARAFEDIPTADVVPKSEVAREIFEEIEKFADRPIPEAKPIYVLKQKDFAELKKKYTESEDT